MEKMHQRVVLVPFPFQGHITPMLQLGAFLHSRGFSITVVHTQFNSPNASNHPEFTFFSIPDGINADEISSKELVAAVLAVNTNCKANLEQYLTQVMAQEPQRKIACIIYDEFMYLSEAVGNCLNIPSILLRTQSAANIIARNALLQLQSKGYIPFPDSRSLNTVPKLHPIRFKDLPRTIFGTPEEYNELLSNAKEVKTSSAIIWNTLNCLEQSNLAEIQQQCQVPIFPIGPFHKIATASSSSLLEEDTGCIEWLEKQPTNSVIYVSLGSLAPLSPNELAEMAWGLANSEQPFLWVIRPRSIPGSDWIELLPQGFIEAIGERGCIVKWAPQREVLAHQAVGGFWTHCGWNSTLESMCEGVPLICWPNFADQMVQARYCSLVWKIGLHLDNKLEREEVEKAVRKLMVDDEGKGMRFRALELKEKIETSLKGGSTKKYLDELVDFLLSF